MEKAVHDARHGLWDDPPPFQSLQDLNDGLQARCRDLWLATAHSEFKARSIAECLADEQPHMMPVTVHDWRHYLSVAQRKPGALRNGAPFRELPESVCQLRARLIKRPDGDREMVEVLALVLLHVEQRMEQAVALALESGEPSKQHILNCLVALVKSLHRCQFLEDVQNIVVVGGPGTGKTHQATAIGVQAIQHHRQRVRFLSTIELVNVLEQEKQACRSARPVPGQF